MSGEQPKEVKRNPTTQNNSLTPVCTHRPISWERSHAVLPTSRVNVNVANQRAAISSPTPSHPRPGSPSIPRKRNRPAGSRVFLCDVARNVGPGESDLSANHPRKMQDIRSSASNKTCPVHEPSEIRHLCSITGSPGGVTRHAESGARFRDGLRDLIRQIHGKS
jgi:hypothetical protein